MDNKIKLYKKLLEIQKTITSLTKDSNGHNFEYTSGSKVLNAIKPIMNDQGLILKQEMENVENQLMEYKTKYGTKTEMFCSIKFKFTWIDTETGETDINYFYSNGMNDFDKGVGSAATYAERYFLLKYFHIPTDKDDNDALPKKDINHNANNNKNNNAKNPKKQLTKEELKQGMLTKIDFCYKKYEEIKTLVEEYKETIDKKNVTDLNHEEVKMLYELVKAKTIELKNTEKGDDAA